MIRKIFPFIIGLLGLGIGIGAGMVLRPVSEEHPAQDGKTADLASGMEEGAPEDPEVLPEFVKMNNQFVVPVVVQGRVVSMVILSLSLEVATGTSEQVYSREPKLRDGFLQVLFDHANSGGFKGSFTDSSNLVLLRRTLMETARSILGEVVQDVLISDIARQDS
jgi:flagellar FliL protein